MKHGILVLFLAICFLGANSQSNESIYIDFTNINSSIFIDRLKDLDNINTLVIKNLKENNSNFQDFGIKSINNLEFENCESYSINQFLLKLGDLSDIKLIKLTNIFESSENIFNKIDFCFEIIEIENCESEVALAFLQKIKDPTKVEILQINFCLLDEFPEILSNFKSLQSLNLNDNIIGSIGLELLKMSKLDSLFLRGNGFSPSSEDCTLLAKTTIKYLELDSLTESEILTLKEQLPNITIVESEVENDTSENKIEYGEIVTSTSYGKVFSNAYLKFPLLFSSPLAQSKLDTTNYEERFLDTSYSGIYKNQIATLNNNSFTIIKVKSPITRKIAFKIGPKKGYYDLKSFYLAYPELTPFKGMVWVLDDTMNKKYFTKVFSRIRFSDFRLDYNTDKHNFTLIFKSAGVLHSLNAFPLNTSNKWTLESSQKKYEEQYARYISILSKKIKKNDKEIKRNCKMLRDADMRYKHAIWLEMQSQMSEEEKLMTQDQWFNYYSKIAGNELNALKNSTPSIELIERALLLLNYQKNNIINNDSLSNNTYSTRFLITDKMDNNIPIKYWIVVNKSTMSFIVHKNHIYYDPINITINKLDNYVLISMLNDNSVSMTQLPQNIIQDSRISSNLVDKDLITIQQILTTLAL